MFYVLLAQLFWIPQSALAFLWFQKTEIKILSKAGVLSEVSDGVHFLTCTITRRVQFLADCWFECVTSCRPLARGHAQHFGCGLSSWQHSCHLFFPGQQGTVSSPKMGIKILVNMITYSPSLLPNSIVQKIVLNPVHIQGEKIPHGSDQQDGDYRTPSNLSAILPYHNQLECQTKYITALPVIGTPGCAGG